ncbi:hypothetical protein [Coleofasciculus sp. FACHB-1120]|uniref:hypothetical protein n=1 Tax=Coleofasciculus sp. FACHB-1120 TaxID=2692783 RepID=UPI0016895565|nr:hypothetical protein [Coleofasciculus sp. FACHB-1120]MBD2742249.1 hypothetical protein [Coleofasciculus sp. FACHB-1120]
MTNKGTGFRSLGLSNGFSAGLKYWLFFLIGFVMLGYRVPLSIFLGAVGGFAGAWVVAWSKAKDEPRQLRSEEKKEGSNGRNRNNSASRKRYGKPKKQYRSLSGRRDRGSQGNNQQNTTAYNTEDNQEDNTEDNQEE